MIFLRRCAPWAFVTLIYGLMAVFATWPLVTDLDGWLLFGERRFDGYGTLWLGEHTWRALTGEGQLLLAPEVAYPAGLDLRLADSFIYAVAYVPLRLFGGPVVAFNLFSLASIALTGTAGYWAEPTKWVAEQVPTVCEI